MRIVVLVKQVPDSTDVKIDPKTGTLVREGVAAVINPDDRLGLETALLLKDAAGAEVVAVSMGPPQAIDALSEAYGMGADKGVLLSDRNFAGADTWSTSYTLGKAIEKIMEDGPVDLVVAGRQAVDGDTAQIGPQVAEHLGWPQITYINRLEFQDGKFIAWRALPSGEENVECPAPAVVTVLGCPTAPRRPLVDRLLFACTPKAPLKVWDAVDIGVKADLTGLRGSPTQVVKTFSPKTQRETQWLAGSPEDQALALFSALKNHKLV